MTNNYVNLTKTTKHNIGKYEKNKNSMHVRACKFIKENNF